MPPRVQTLPKPSSANIPLSQQPSCPRCLRRSFGSTPQFATKLRREMFAWLNGPGENFRYPLPNSTNYLSAYDRRGNLLRQSKAPQKSSAPANADNADSAGLESAAEEKKLEQESSEDLRPFPLNQHFMSESVLSEDLRKEIYRRVKVEGKPLRVVSVELGVEMRRIAAVVRLVEVENRWKAEGKPLATPYAKAVHSMIPTTPYKPGQTIPTPHEPINDLPVHALTHPQLFYPTSESRAFNRVDAGRVFSGAPRLPDSQDVGQGGTDAPEPWKDQAIEIVGKKGHERAVLKPADSRIPHPHMVAHEKDKQTMRGEEWLVNERFMERIVNEVEERRAAREGKRELEEKHSKRVETERWEFIVKQVKATRSGTGLDGRGTQSPGYRYGVPSQDRKRAQFKLPRRIVV